MTDGRISNFRQIASVRRYKIIEGREKGIDVIDCDTGKIRFLLNVTKGLDIMQVYHEGQNVSFLSKNAFIAYNLPFENRFEGGMLYTCGLDSMGGRDGYEIHGTYHKTVADVTRAECTESGITVEATIINSALFGKNLVMKRRITADIGGETIKLNDTLTNEAFVDGNYCVLYHVNLGYPMLDEGGKIVTDAASVTPRTPWAKEKFNEVFDITAPLPAQEETCYFIRLNKPEAAYINEKLGKKFLLKFSGNTLPCFVEWKSMASGDYALGLEPCSAELDGGFRYDTLPAKGSVDFELSLTVTRI
ncbi:MAG: DUF4432 family protein [Clostridia bacterium]|nr:DUF4432 family protein [Clostridia bacterium]